MALASSATPAKAPPIPSARLPAPEAKMLRVPASSAANAEGAKSATESAARASSKRVRTGPGRERPPRRRRDPQLQERARRLDDADSGASTSHPERRGVSRDRRDPANLEGERGPGRHPDRRSEGDVGGDR